jgi:hypothetical protein
MPSTVVTLIGSAKGGWMNAASTLSIWLKTTTKSRKILRSFVVMISNRVKVKVTF